MKWNLLIFTYICPNYLLKVFSKEKDYLKKIIDLLIYEYYKINNNLKITHTNMIVEYIYIYPRITHLVINKLDINDEIYNLADNRYIFNGDKNSDTDKKFIYSNILLPHKTSSSIPFSFGITNNNTFKLINSNIFYFETYLDIFNFREPFDNEVFRIGFTSSYYNSNMIEFGSNSFGVDLLNNFMCSRNEFLFFDKIIKKGDIVGIGLEYTNIDEYNLFITVNGELLESKIKINTSDRLKLIVSLKMSTGINVNFGDKNFIFDIEKIINYNKIVYSSNNNFITNFDLDKLNTENILNNYETIYNWISTF